MKYTITNLIADIRKWEKNAKKVSANPKLAEVCSALCPLLDSIGTRLEQLVKDGFYVTPEAKRTDYARLFECPSLNFRLSQFQSPQAARYIGYFEPVVKPGCGKAPQNAKHVYEIRIDRTVKPYEAVACCDGNFLFSLKSNNYQVAKFGAVKTLFGRMRHTCKATRRNIAAKEGK